nr:hypothetical protein [Tanacetum cinerariifolium]
MLETYGISSLAHYGGSGDGIANLALQEGSGDGYGPLPTDFRVVEGRSIGERV